VIKSDVILPCKTLWKSISKWSWVPRRRASRCKAALHYSIRILDNRHGCGTTESERTALNGRNVFKPDRIGCRRSPAGQLHRHACRCESVWLGQLSGKRFVWQPKRGIPGRQPLTSVYINLPVLIPTQDSIQEFRVQTSNLGPEWGKFSGGVTNLSTKSGTNSPHGEAYEYIRNKIFMPTISFSTLLGNPGRPGCKTSSVRMLVAP